MQTAALAFLLIALVAGLFGFGVVASAAAEIAQVLFWLFLVLFVISLLSGLISDGNDVFTAERPSASLRAATRGAGGEAEGAIPQLPR